MVGDVVKYIGTEGPPEQGIVDEVRPNFLLVLSTDSSDYKKREWDPKKCQLVKRPKLYRSP